MKKLLFTSISVFLLAGLSTLKANDKQAKRVYEGVVEELIDRKDQCNFNFWKLEANAAWGLGLGVKGDIFYDRFLEAYTQLPEIEKSLEKQGVELEFSVSPKLKEIDCDLSKNAVRYNYGSVAVIRGLQRIVQFSRDETDFSVDVIRVEVSEFSGRELYQRNRFSKEAHQYVSFDEEGNPVVKTEEYFWSIAEEESEDGSKRVVATIRAHPVDYETGLILFPLFSALTN